MSAVLSTLEPRQRVKGLIVAKGMSYKEVAEKVTASGVEMSTRALSARLNGHVDFFVPEVMALSDVLGLDANEMTTYFFGRARI